jgi:hypothetical protein
MGLCICVYIPFHGLKGIHVIHVFSHIDGPVEYTCFGNGPVVVIGSFHSRGSCQIVLNMDGHLAAGPSCKDLVINDQFLAGIHAYCFDTRDYR